MSEREWMAFPHNFLSDGGPADTGMTLRDYFAAKAMQALITEPPWSEGSTASVHQFSTGYKGSDVCGRFAFAAYRMADAMLEARK